MKRPRRISEGTPFQGVLLFFGAGILLFGAVLVAMRLIYGPAPGQIQPPRDLVVLERPRGSCAVRESDGVVLGEVLEVQGQNGLPTHLMIQSVASGSRGAAPGTGVRSVISMLGVDVEPCAGRYFFH